MNTRSKFFIVLIIACTIFSCTSRRALYKAFTRKKVSLNYIHDSHIEPVKRAYTICVKKPVVTDSRFVETGKVSRVSAYVIPAIVYNEWKAIHDYRIGSSVIAEDIPTFITQSVQAESKRSGTFLADTISTADRLTLEIEIDSLGASGPYVDKGYIFYALMVYGYSMSENAGPGIAYSQFHYKLKRGEDVIIEDYVNSRQVSQPLVSLHKSNASLRSSYTGNLVEALSQTFKRNIETIVNDIDTLIDIETDKSLR